ncbi:hypothetical protein ANCCAN_06612, partial [Ancylostoma caninum]
ASIVVTISPFVVYPTPFAVKLPLHEAEKLTGQNLVEYVRRHQNLFEVEESKEADERMKYLLDPKYLISPDDKDRKEDDDDVEPPEEILLGCLSCISHDRQIVRTIQRKDKGFSYITVN